MPKKTVCQQQAANFKTLKAAFANGDVCLMECLEIKSQEIVAVLCAVSRDPQTGDFITTPFARFFNGNPFEALKPPNPEGGF